jgi:hypothetical protein
MGKVLMGRMPGPQSILQQNCLNPAGPGTKAFRFISLTWENHLDSRLQNTPIPFHVNTGQILVSLMGIFCKNTYWRKKKFMHFDSILFIGIAIIGPYFGGKMCALLEKKVTGKVRFEMEFKNKRLISVLIAIAGSYIGTVET